MIPEDHNRPPSAPDNTAEEAWGADVSPPSHAGLGSEWDGFLTPEKAFMMPEEPRLDLLRLLLHRDDNWKNALLGVMWEETPDMEGVYATYLRALRYAGEQRALPVAEKWSSGKGWGGRMGKFGKPPLSAL